MDADIERMMDALVRPTSGETAQTVRMVEGVIIPTKSATPRNGDRR